MDNKNIVEVVLNKKDIIVENGIFAYVDSVWHSTETPNLEFVDEKKAEIDFKHNLTHIVLDEQSTLTIELLSPLNDKKKEFLEHRIRFLARVNDLEILSLKIT